MSQTDCPAIVQALFGWANEHDRSIVRAPGVESLTLAEHERIVRSETQTALNRPSATISPGPTLGIDVCKNLEMSKRSVLSVPLLAWLASLLTVTLLSGCAVVAVADMAVTTAATVVTTGVKAVGAVVDAVIPGD